MAAFFTENPFRKRERPLSTERASLGRRSEKLTAQYLKNKGWTVIGANIRFKVGEVDLLAFDPLRKRYVVVEVRAKSSRRYLPSRTLSNAKLERLKLLARLIQLDKRRPVHLLFIEVLKAGERTIFNEFPIENY